ncbi:hypothetical protein L3X38_024476 [Prunus dulcis]|uniref:Uncharacterized protein n=1 Tax=Prunus dulcis TaxID=3755 RepID=A0AAD4Z731_PRUDU|nr:hypothetical protein L3X38_024476 [Prunus dulcis]
MNGSLGKLMATPTHSKYPTPMDPNPTPNPTLAITEGGDTETPAKAATEDTEDWVHGLQQCRANTMFWKNLHADIVSKIKEGQASAVIAFKESDEMAQLKQQQLESGFELFRKFAQIVDAEGKWDITVGGVMNLMGRGRRI